MGFFSTILGTGKNTTRNSKVNASAGSSQGGLNWAQMVADEPENQSKFTVYDAAGTPLQLRETDQKAAGGEGTVYEFAKNPKYLIKVYKDDILKNPSKMKELRSRIEDMTMMQKCAQMDFLAWPLMPVMNRNREVIGFVMRKVEGRSLLSLRGPESVRKFFPGWDRRNLVLVALDYVSKIRQLVQNGVLVNDFNPSNFLIDRRGRVSFIDCDSYQVPAKNGGYHLTHTFFPAHTAPELILKPQLLSARRTVHQVEFATVLNVFYILMMGMHPYTYVDPNHKSACGTPDENLRRGKCPLGKGADCSLPCGGWYNLWSYLTFQMKGLFIQTFKDGHGDPARRPTLDQLHEVLQLLLWVMDQDPERRNLNPRIPCGKNPKCFQGDREKWQDNLPGGRKSSAGPKYYGQRNNQYTGGML